MRYYRVFHGDPDHEIKSMKEQQDLEDDRKKSDPPHRSTKGREAHLPEQTDCDGNRNTERNPE